MKRLIALLLLLASPVLAGDTFNSGYTFTGETGLHTGAQLDDLVERARYAAGAFDGSTGALFNSTWFTNDANLRLTLKTNSISGSYIEDGTITDNDLSDTVKAPNRSYISGCYLSVTGTNTASISVGEGVCKDKYFRLTAAASVSVTGIPSTNDIMFAYMDYSASTFPSTLSFYATTNDPVWVTSQAGYYAATSTYDRLIGQMITTNGVTTLEQSINTDGAQILTNTPTLWVSSSPHYTGIALAQNFNPSGVLVAPTISSSTYLSIAARSAKFQLSSDGGPTSGTIGKGWSAMSLADCAAAGTSNFLFTAMSVTKTENVLWLELGSSRNVLISGEDDDYNSLGLGLLGWRIQR